MGLEEIFEGFDEAGQLYDQRWRSHVDWEDFRGGHSEGGQVRTPYMFVLSWLVCIVIVFVLLLLGEGFCVH